MGQAGVQDVGNVGTGEEARDEGMPQPQPMQASTRTHQLSSPVLHQLGDVVDAELQHNGLMGRRMA